MDKIKKVF